MRVAYSDGLIGLCGALQGYGLPLAIVLVMSARPGRVKAVYDNDLPRPRSMDVQITDRFIELKREVWDLVQEEVVRSMTALQSR